MKIKGPDGRIGILLGWDSSEQGCYAIVQVLNKVECWKSCLIEIMPTSDTAELAATDSQQIKPKIPEYSEVLKEANRLAGGTVLNDGERDLIKGIYDFISRNFGH